jgi:hypothetical protein
VTERRRWSCTWNGAVIEVEATDRERTLRVDGRVVDQTRIGVGAYLCAKVHLAGAERIVEAHVEYAVDWVGVACKIFVDEVVVGGDVDVVFRFAEPTRYARWRRSFFVPPGEQGRLRDQAEYTFRTRQKKLGDPTWVSPLRRFLALFFIALGILVCGDGTMLLIAVCSREAFGVAPMLVPLGVIGLGVGSLLLSARLLHPKARVDKHLPESPPQEQPAAASLERMPTSASDGRRRRARS